MSEATGTEAAAGVIRNVRAIVFASAVNCTLGMPHIRTSPDHGTAFGIAV